MIATALSGLGTQLATVSGLRVYSFVPEQINPPAAVVALGAGTYDDDFDGACTFDATVLVLVSEAQGNQRAQAAFQTYVDPTGSSSIVAAINASPTLSGSVNSVRVLGWDAPQSFDIGGIAYAGVEVNLEMIASS